MKQTFRSLCAVVGVALLSTGCMELDVAFDVRADGSGSMDMSIDLDAAAFSQLLALDGTSNAGSPEEVCDELLSDMDPAEGVADGVSSVLVNDGVRCAVELQAEWPAGGIDSSGLFGADDEGFPFGLSEGEPGHWRFDFTATEFFADATSDLEDVPAQWLEMLDVEMTLSVSVSLPGEVVDHNGELRGNVVSWDFDMLDPPPSAEFYAMAAPAARPSAFPVLLGVVGVGVLVVVLIFRRSRTAVRAADPGAPSGLAPAPPGTPAGWLVDSDGRRRWWDGAAWTSNTLD